jgi:membrane-associated progesterone receptor component
MYGPGGAYAVFAGKDASRALGLSSTKHEDAVPDWSTLDAEALKTLDGWYDFFTCVLDPFFFLFVFSSHILGVSHRRKRYNIVGHVIDLPAAVANMR